MTDYTEQPLMDGTDHESLFWLLLSAVWSLFH